MADNAFVKIGTALFKHQMKKLVGEETLGVISDELADIGGDKLDTWFGDKSTIEALEIAAQTARDSFREKVRDIELEQYMRDLPLHNLPKVMEAIEELPTSPDEIKLENTLREAITRDWKKLSPEQVDNIVNAFMSCLRSALLPIEKQTLTVIGRSVLRTEDKVNRLLKLAENLQAAKSGTSHLTLRTRELKAEQERVLEAAIEKQVSVGRSAQLFAWIKRVESKSIISVVGSIDEDVLLDEDNVRSKGLEIEFPVENGLTLPAEVSLQLTALDFNPPQQQKKINVPPDWDSEICTFTVVPKKAGKLLLSLEVLKGTVSIANRTLRTIALEIEKESQSPMVLVSIPIIMVVNSLLDRSTKNTVNVGGDVRESVLITGNNGGAGEILDALYDALNPTHESAPIKSILSETENNDIKVGLEKSGGQVNLSGDEAISQGSSVRLGPGTVVYGGIHTTVTTHDPREIEREKKEAEKENPERKKKLNISLESVTPIQKGTEKPKRETFKLKPNHVVAIIGAVATIIAAIIDLALPWIERILSQTPR